MDLSLTTRFHGPAVVVLLDGEVDLYTAPTMREGLAELIRAGHHHLVVDLCNVGFLDSSGLGVLIDALNAVRPHDGSVHLVCDREHIVKVFAVTGLGELFPIHPSVEDAVACVGAPRTSSPLGG